MYAWTLAFAAITLIAGLIGRSGMMPFADQAAKAVFISALTMTIVTALVGVYKRYHPQ